MQQTYLYLWGRQWRYRINKRLYEIRYRNIKYKMIATEVKAIQILVIKKMCRFFIIQDSLLTFLDNKNALLRK